MPEIPDRALLFIDGNNWFHGMGDLRVGRRRELDYRKISEKLVGPRQWIGTRYYIGRMTQDISPKLYAEQRSFLADIERDDPRVSVHLGRFERHWKTNEAAEAILSYLGGLTIRIEPQVYQELKRIATAHARTLETKEKAVDVMVALDLVTMALRDEYDAGYLLACDGDYAPAAAEVARLGKKLYVVATGPAAALSKVAFRTIPLKAGWFSDCYR